MKNTHITARILRIIIGSLVLSILFIVAIICSLVTIAIGVPISAIYFVCWGIQYICVFAWGCAEDVHDLIFPYFKA